MKNEGDYDLALNAAWVHEHSAEVRLTETLFLSFRVLMILGF